jgi:hypothetical protein
MNAVDSLLLARLRSMRDQLSQRRAMQEKLIAFERELCTNNRFFPQSSILEWVDAIAPMVMRTLPKGTLLYRGRIITKAEEDVFFAPLYNALGVYIENEDRDLDHTRFAEAYVQHEIDCLEAGEALPNYDDLQKQLSSLSVKGWWGFDREASGAAPSDVTGNGRINPVGISYLYASNRKETAALETRPVISQMVSIAEVVLTEDVTLFDLSRHVFDDDDTPDEETKMFRKLLAHYFAKPNYSGDQAYLVTQYISEYVKSNIEITTGLKFDGLCFSSSLDRLGTNYVIFDTTENPKYEIVASSLEKLVDMQGTLEMYLPLTDATVRALIEGTL